MVFDLLIVCSLLVCRGFARRGTGFARRGFGFCLVCHGFARCGYGFLVLNVDGGLWVTGGGGVKCTATYMFG